jgi:hypothetical protein
VTPPRLAPRLQCLPAILYTLGPNPIPSCSKAPRGLSVLPRVTCIFTGNAISPSLWPRQRPTRCAIRAGRNLPDKEFRYLRTVIVTAAVYRGFSSRLSPLSLTFRHRAGVSPYTSRFRFAETCVFSKQSVGPLRCDLDRFTGKPLHGRRHPFSRSYGAILPSSLARVLSIALVSSTRLPASVCGTGTCALPRGFSWKHGLSHYSPREEIPRSLSQRSDGFTCRSSLRIRAGLIRSPGWPTLLRPPFR